jgi:hypothetical protein
LRVVVTGCYGSRMPTLRARRGLRSTLALAVLVGLSPLGCSAGSATSTEDGTGGMATDSETAATQTSGSDPTTSDANDSDVTSLGSEGSEGSGDATAANDSGDTGDEPEGCAILLVDETFEDGEYLDTFDQGENSGAVAVVSTNDGAVPYAGDHCLRGNFRIGHEDPLTGLAATSRYSGLDIPLGGVRGFAVSLRYRIDPDAQWIMDDGSDTGLGYKFFYLMGTPWDNTLNWVLSQLWSSEHWAFNDNQPSQNTGYSESVYADPSDGELGEWHLIEIFASLNSAPGVADGRFRLRVNSNTYIDLSDVPWQTSTEQTFGVLGGVPHMYGGCCGPKYPFGWQVDDLKVWEIPDGCEPP